MGRSHVHHQRRDGFVRPCGRGFAFKRNPRRFADVEARGGPVLITVDDGSAGNHGAVPKHRPTMSRVG
jgi:hypothetical protein